MLVEFFWCETFRLVQVACFDKTAVFAEHFVYRSFSHDAATHEVRICARMSNVYQQISTVSLHLLEISLRVYLLRHDFLHDSFAVLRLLHLLKLSRGSCSHSRLVVYAGIHVGNESRGVPRQTVHILL